jgi:hypothetical protein
VYVLFVLNCGFAGEEVSKDFGEMGKVGEEFYWFLNNIVEFYD